MTNFRFGRDVAPHQRPPVCWYHPLVLFKIAIDVLSSLNQFRNRDERESFTLPLTLIDRSQSSDKDKDFWFDFLADTGDGGNATYSVATTVLADSVQNQDGLPLLRGELLLLGGDLAYPSASTLEYRYRFVEMFEAALPEGSTARSQVRGQPFTVAALPQNHDWMDSASTFGRYFIRNKQLRQFLGADIPQQQSYFCVRLPHGWWVLGLDFAMTDDIDRDQFEQFTHLLSEQSSPGILQGDRVILIYPHPVWTTPVSEGVYPGGALRYQLLEGLLGHRIALRLTGDLHHYSRWTSTQEGQLVICGSGGAFTHPTHTRLTNSPIVLQRVDNAKAIPESAGCRVQIGIDDGQPQVPVHAFEKVKGREFPPLAQSRRLAWGNITALFGAGGTWADGNRWFAALMGLLYLFGSVMAASGLGVMLMLLMFGILCLSIGWEALQEVSPQWSAWRCYGLTVGSSLMHTLCHCGVVWGLAHNLPIWILAVLPPAGAIGASWLAGLGMLMSGALLGTLMFGTWLAVMSWCGYLTNNGFSALALQDFKGFMRFKISTDGVLHGYFVAIDKTPRQWKWTNGAHKRPICQPSHGRLTARVHDAFTLQKSDTSL